MKYIGLHHTAVSRKKQTRQLEAVNTYHRNKNWGTTENPWYQPRPSRLGWYVAYNEFIDVDSTTTKTRKYGEETLAIVKHNCDVKENCDTYHICIAGDFNKELLTDDQVAILRKRINELIKDNPGVEVRFHSSLDEKRTCPGALFSEQYLNTVVLGMVEIKPDVSDQEKSKRILELSQEVEKLKKNVGVLSRLIQWLLKLL